MDETLKKRAVRAGGWRIARRLLKPIPIIGTVFVVGFIGYEIKKKGLFRGSVNVALDATPVLGTAKGILELFTGDLIRPPKRLQPATKPLEEQVAPATDPSGFADSNRVA